MAAGVRNVTGSDWGLAVTGVAGPDPQEGHPAGEVWVGLAAPGTAAMSRRLDLAGDRDAVRAATVAGALGWLVEELRATQGSRQG
jgi:nicotinamide-nucleotide amidase